MKPIRKEDLDALMADVKPPAITIYLPTVRAGRQVRQNPIRFGNLVRAVQKQLDADDGLDDDARDSLLAPLQVLREDYTFWQHQSEGLVVFRDRDRIAVHPLPVAVDPQAHVGSTYAIRPVLPLMMFDGRFHLLEFGQEDVHLYAGTRYELREVILPEDTPTCLQDVVGHRLEGPHLQHHSGNGAGQTAIFHGQGAGDTKEDGEMRKYATWVAHSLPQAMDPEAPVVLAGTEKTVGLFRRVCGWQTLCDDWVHGAPGSFDAEDLHARAWAIVEPKVRERLMRRLDAIEGLESKGQATHDLDAALDAARQGRVDTLYLTGEMNGEAERIEELARETYDKGGRVFEVEPPMLPGDRAFEAVFRY